MLKIYTVTDHFFTSVKALFKEIGTVEILPKKTDDVMADLIVFTGGGDINPSAYGENDRGLFFDNKRDTLELNTMNKIYTGTLATKKVLGICRGHQLLNVSTGGTLWYDITEKFGKPHDCIHSLTHVYPNPLDFLTEVNSMHHQCIRTAGDRFPRGVIATNPADNTVEIIHWRDVYLGVQFHPEFFRVGGEKSRKFALVIKEWINGNASFQQKFAESQKSANLKKKLDNLTPEEESRRRIDEILRASVERMGTTGEVEYRWETTTTNSANINPRISSTDNEDHPF